MKIIISSIPEEGLNLQFHKDSDWFRDLLPEKEKSDFSLQKVDVLCAVKKMRETVFIEGNLEATVVSSCSRCLETTQFLIKSTFRYTFVPAKNMLMEEELSPEDLEYGFYQDDVIDLDSLIFEQIVLQIPIKVLCRDTCKGLCPHCGININVANCGCRTEFIDERLAVLKKLKISDNK
ncbi:MAG: DUF177 domain-containing protein [Bacillota bacterium]|nr:DUF177 domain-containing protein [Bacillota bacterium]